MSAAMPYGGPSLSTETWTLIAAYILQSNGAAAGTEALSLSAASGRTAACRKPNAKIAWVGAALDSRLLQADHARDPIGLSALCARRSPCESRALHGPRTTDPSVDTAQSRLSRHRFTRRIVKTN